jgi:hypothetical protein
MAVSYWVESMARDERHAIDDHKARLLDQELRDFADSIWTPKEKPEGHSWVNLR